MFEIGHFDLASARSYVKLVDTTNNKTPPTASSETLTREELLAKLGWQKAKTSGAGFVMVGPRRPMAGPALKRAFGRSPLGPAPLRLGLADGIVVHEGHVHRSDLPRQPSSTPPRCRGIAGLSCWHSEAGWAGAARPGIVPICDHPANTEPAPPASV